MSVSNQTYKTSGSGNGVTQTFSFPFKVFDSTELLVYLINTATSAVTGPLILNTDYTVNINTVTEGGTVNFAVAPATGYQFLIQRIVPYTQTAVIPSEGVFPGKQFENQLDLMTMMIIQAQGAISNVIQMPSTYLGAALTFPLPAANQVIGWDPTGTFLKNLVVGGQGPQGPAGPTGPTGPAGSGSVTTISSANTDISVSNPTTTPVLTLNSGIGANQILKLNSSAQIPAVDGSLLTNLTFAHTRVFTASGTFTAPVGVTKVYLTMVGGGGGGAGGHGGASGSGGAGGAGGSHAVGSPYTVIAGNNYTVTINNGGSAGTGGSSVGGSGGDGGTGGSVVFDTLTIPGGNGGSGVTGGTGVSSSPSAGVAAGSGGTGGAFISAYSAGGAGGAGNGTSGLAGGGGASLAGPGGNGDASGSNPGLAGSAPASGFGGGGGGGGNSGGGNTGGVGGAGAKGIVIVQW